MWPFHFWPHLPEEKGKRTRMISPSVLIVEDDALSRRLTSRVLTDDGFQTAIATTPDVAFRLLEDFPFCILLDLELPDGNGVEILRLIRRSNSPIKVAVLRESDDYSHVGTAVLLKPGAFFRKPELPAELIEWVTSVSPHTSRFRLRPSPLGVYDRT
jgi:CheY-like chemotaxis protein